MTRPAHLVKLCAALLVLTVASVALALTTPQPASAVTSGTVSGDESQFLTLLNRERVNRNLPALVSDGELASTSRSWSQHMASRVKLYHDPNLAAVATYVEPSWRSVGENVGAGYSVQSLHDAFMASKGHRDNILSGRFNRVGIGVAFGGGKTWVTVRFLEGPAIAGTTGLEPCAAARTGSSTVVAGDVTGDKRDDLLANGPTATDPMLRGNTSRVFGSSSMSVGGTYIPLSGDFTGSGRADVLWYAPGPAPDYLWRSSSSGFSSTPMSIGGTYQPSVGDLDGDGRDDILWYAPGPAPDYAWYGTSTSGRFSSTPRVHNGFYQVAIADLDGDRRADVVWYARGTAKDYINYSTGRGSYASVPVTINGHYRPAAGDFDGDRLDDVMWHAPGSAKDYVWYGLGARGRYQSVEVTVGGTYEPVTGDFDGDCRTDIVWSSGPDVTGDPLWYGSSSRGGFSNDTVRTG